MGVLDAIGTLCVTGALIAGILWVISWLVYTGAEWLKDGDFFPGSALIILAVLFAGLIIAGIEAGA